MSTCSRPRLWLAMRFPDLCLNALGLQEAEACAIIAEKQTVFYATGQAKKRGVVLGMNLPSAQLLCGGDALVRDLQAEQRALRQLAQVLYQFTPYIEEFSCGHEYGLLLEVSQCLRLFKGIDNLSNQVFQCLATRGFSFRAGLAHSAKGAWLLSYYTHPIRAGDSREVFIERLNRVALKYLRGYPEQVAQLAKSGFYSLGDISQQIEKTSIESLKRRFDSAFVDFICEVFDIGKDFFQGTLFAKPRKVYRPKQDFYDVIYFDYPVKTLEHLKPALQQLLQNLQAYFAQRQCEFSQIIWYLYDIFSNKTSIVIQCAYPQISIDMFYELSCLKLDAQGLPFEVDTLSLHCNTYNVIHSRNRSLVFASGEDSQSVEESFSLTAAKLSMVVGEKSIFKISYRDSLVPELSNHKVSLQGEVKQDLPPLYKKALRPSWIFSQPQPIAVKQQGLYWQGELTLLSRAERIEALWWQEGVSRDYFLAQRQDSLPLWIFLDLKCGNWYVHGIFA